jgi:hypothetical protein
LALIAAAHAAHAAIKVPGCADLTQFGKEIDMAKMVPLNRAQGQFVMPAAYMAPRAEQLFGQPTLAWSQDDVAQIVKQTGDCANEAKKARNVPDTQALTVLWQSLGHVRGTLGAIVVNEQRLDQRLKLLIEAESSRPALASVTIVAAAAHEDTAASLQTAAQALKDNSVQVNAWHPVHANAQAMLDLLRSAPTQSWQRIVPPTEKRAAELQRWAVDDAKVAINATPETLEGLRAMPAALAKIKGDIGKWLPATELAGLDAAAEARRNAVEDALVAKVAASIEAAPASPDTLVQLRALQQANPLKAVLSPQRSAALDAKIDARRTATGEAVTDAQIKRLDSFPETMAGLQQLDAYKTETSRGIEQFIGPAAATRFREAAGKRASRIGETAFGPFRTALRDLPENEDGLAKLDHALAEMKTPLASLDPALQARYTEASTKRHDEIAAAVKKEDARLAKLPLVGAVYTDPEWSARLEFRDRTRVYAAIPSFQDCQMVASGDITKGPRDLKCEIKNVPLVQSTYEVDGDKVIIRLANPDAIRGIEANYVFVRQGGWLKGERFNFKRQGDK